MKSKKLNIFVHAVFCLMVVAVILPLLGVVMISVTDAEEVRRFGYRFLPEHFSLDAYRLIFANFMPVFKAMALTVCTGAFGVGMGLMFCAAMAYGISSPGFAYKKIANTFILIPMVVSGGLVPTYIVNTRLLGMGDSIWIYLIPGCSSWTIILFRTFFMGISSSLIESARIDGASELTVFARIIMPLSKSIFASQFCIGFLGNWNDFSKPLYYITNKNLYNIQYLLQNILKEASYLNELYKDNPAFAGKLLPEETIPYAMAVVSCIPVVLMFPYMQKYFSKGLTVGSVKG